MITYNLIVINKYVDSYFTYMNCKIKQTKKIVFTSNYKYDKLTKKEKIYGKEK